MKKKVAGRYKSKANYLLSGLLRCGICGKTMYGNTRTSGNNSKSVFSSYRCSGGKHYCSNKEINKRYLDMYVLTELKKIFLNRSKYRQLMVNVNRYIEKQHEKFLNDIDVCTNRLIDVNNSIANITSAVEKGLLSDDFFDRLEELQNEKASLETTIAKLSKCSTTQCNLEDVDAIIAKNKSYVQDITSQ
ncbi:MAG: hypothetical protein EOM05_12495 [Clostridia bacterium]|nr:hypothetical protein [Clostridia bacterium]